jgi:predicted alpha/beta superfamily hydrolase
MEEIITMGEDRVCFEAGGRKLTLHKAGKSGALLIVLNNFSGNGSSIVEQMRRIGRPDCSLLSIGGLNWDHDMAPWYYPPLTKKDTSCTGRADQYLEALLDRILTEALARTDGEPEYLGLAGYSLAGLFALYAMYRTDRFSRVCSMSGSLWFPDFREFALSQLLAGRPDRLYLSIGSREARSRIRMLQSVQDNTEFLADFYQRQGILYELNPGNHYQDADLRCAKGIAWILK